jgi:hypothetical protein
MNLGGWLFLGLSWGSILILTAYCFWKVIREKE